MPRRTSRQPRGSDGVDAGSSGDRRSSSGFPLKGREMNPRAPIRDPDRMDMREDQTPGALDPDRGLDLDLNDIHGDGEGCEDPLESASHEESAELIRCLIGALAMLLIDRGCRDPYVALEPGMDTLFALCRQEDLPARRPKGGAEDASPEPQPASNPDSEELQQRQRRRIASARVVTGLVQRSAEARLSLVRSGSLRHVIALINLSDEVSLGCCSGIHINLKSSYDLEWI